MSPKYQGFKNFWGRLKQAPEYIRNSMKEDLERKRRAKGIKKPDAKIGGISDAFQFDTEPIKDKEDWSFL